MKMLRLYNSAITIQKSIRGYVVHKEYKVKLHRYIVDYYVNYWKYVKFRNHTNLQVKLKYAFKKYKIKKKKKADAAKRKKDAAAKGKKKKKKPKAPDPMQRRVSVTQGGSIDIKTTDQDPIEDSSMLDDPRLDNDEEGEGDEDENEKNEDGEGDDAQE